MEIVIRIACVFLLLTLAFRTLGKRELSQLSPFELVMLLLVAEIVAPALTAGDESLTGAFFGAATLLFLTFVHSVATYRLEWFRGVAEAPPSLLVRHGRIDERLMHLERIRPDEIFSEMHKAGIERLSQVRWGFLEPDGKMSFVRSDDGETQDAQEQTPV
jgi:uncharacterized membrane protein YcaP (DUF421 family)